VFINQKEDDEQTRKKQTYGKEYSKKIIDLSERKLPQKNPIRTDVHYGTEMQERRLHAY